MKTLQLIYWSIASLIILSVFIKGNKQLRRLFLFLLIVFVSSCNNNKLTKKDLMNAYTVGWHQGYEQGKWQFTDKESELFWKKSRWIQDSLFMENQLWAIK